MREPKRPKASEWAVEHHRGGAGGFHGRDLPVPARRSVWWFEVARPTLVLGSTQPAAMVDDDAVRARGVEVVRRRSGGSAVLLEPGGGTWLDLVIPVGDPLWDDDVGRAAHWVGEAWTTALTRLGVGDLAVHRSGLVRARWSDRVCFAGLGPGEVCHRGRKLVGVSQRRTREGARFQCMLLHDWEPAHLGELLRLDAAERQSLAADLAGVAIGVPVEPPAVLDALLDALPLT